jgi:hypothetical protein
VSKIVIGRQFCGPPNSGNGGYVCGALADGLRGAVTSVLRAPIPLDLPLELDRQGGQNHLIGPEGAVIGKAEETAGELPDPPLVPTLEAARAAGGRYLGHQSQVHPICFTCGTARDEGDGLRVFPGQLEGAQPGVVACAWTPHAAFADTDGRISTAALWAALDCPGFFAWVEKEGRHGALLGTMTAEVVERPPAGEACIVLAWPLVREGRKEMAGVALFGADGRLMARAHQVWITMGPRPEPAPAPSASETAAA